MKRVISDGRVGGTPSSVLVGSLGDGWVDCQMSCVGVGCSLGEWTLICHWDSGHNHYYVSEYGKVLSLRYTTVNGCLKKENSMSGEVLSIKHNNNLFI